VKCTYEEREEPEYLIVAEKRIAEFMARSSYTNLLGQKESFELKVLLLMQGEQLKDMVL
jgi:hypothetical protein